MRGRGIVFPLRRRGDGVAPAADGKLHKSSSPHYHTLNKASQVRFSLVFYQLLKPRSENREMKKKMPPLWAFPFQTNKLQKMDDPNEDTEW
jgi:hypothetical protein